jgi:hypothetical protein
MPFKQPHFQCPQKKWFIFLAKIAELFAVLDDVTQ